MVENECSRLREDVDELREYVFGNFERRGLSARLDITETRLAIFWWVLAVVGTSAIGLITATIYNVIYLNNIPK